MLMKPFLLALIATDIALGAIHYRANAPLMSFVFTASALIVGFFTWLYWEHL